MHISRTEAHFHSQSPFYKSSAVLLVGLCCNISRICLTSVAKWVISGEFTCVIFLFDYTMPHQFKSTPARPFVMHFDVAVNGGIVVRVSFSNGYTVRRRQRWQRQTKITSRRTCEISKAHTARRVRSLLHVLQRVETRVET